MARRFVRRALVPLLTAFAAGWSNGPNGLTVFAAAASDPVSKRVGYLVGNLTTSEKVSLVNGIGWTGWSLAEGYYVGNTPAISRDGVFIPSLNMQDASQGFRTYDSATWDVNLVSRFAVAAATEFRAKGANVVLGPGLNVQRVGRGGRNAEYIGGEDPFLGATLAPYFIKGFQENKVLTVMKHFALNNQENSRGSVNVVVDDARTAYEVYYPPYRACIEADVAATMCSYNKVNGSYACENEQLLTNDLKGTMGFNGWVMSDWAATHSLSANEGLDQDMPGSSVDNGAPSGESYFNAADMTSFAEESSANSDRLDDMVTRILTPMARYGLLDDVTCIAGVNCSHHLYEANATSKEHTELARTIATDSVLLLKNANGPNGSNGSNGPTLPLGTGITVAVVGSACDAPNEIADMNAKWNLGSYYVVGGSGRVIPASVTSIAGGIRAMGVTVVESLTDVVTDAVAAMDGADAVVICGGTTTTESTDRSDLSLEEEDFISDVAALSNISTVVAMMTPGAVVLPFLDDVDALLNVFLGGAATGLAVADVLFGVVNPSAKSPITWPVDEDDVTAPCDSTDCYYDEGLFVGYRGLGDVEVNFPFGHGLSYTNFTYGAAGEVVVEGGTLSWTINITNTGPVAGSEVAQLYVTFPSSAGEPDLVLKSFAKTAIEPGATENVTFNVPATDMLVWSNEAWAFVNVSHSAGVGGNFTARVGSSSRDIRLSTEFVLWDHSCAGCDASNDDVSVAIDDANDDTDDDAANDEDNDGESEDGGDGGGDGGGGGGDGGDDGAMVASVVSASLVALVAAAAGAWKGRRLFEDYKRTRHAPMSDDDDIFQEGLSDTGMVEMVDPTDQRTDHLNGTAQLAMVPTRAPGGSRGTAIGLAAI